MVKENKGRLDKGVSGQSVEQCEKLDKENLMQILKIYGIAYELREQGMKPEMQDVRNHVENMGAEYSRRIESVQKGLGIMGINEMVAIREERNQALSQFFEKTYEKYRDYLPDPAVFKKRLQGLQESPVTQGGLKEITKLQSELYSISAPSEISASRNPRRPLSRLR